MLISLVEETANLVCLNGKVVIVFIVVKERIGVLVSIMVWSTSA